MRQFNQIMITRMHSNTSFTCWLVDRLQHNLSFLTALTLLYPRIGIQTMAIHELCHGS